MRKKIQYILIVLLIIFSNYSCMQEPYDWSNGETYINNLTFTDPAFHDRTVEFDVSFDITGDPIDSIRFDLTVNKYNSWLIQKRISPTLVKGNTYKAVFENLYKGSQYKIEVLIWANNDSTCTISKSYQFTVPLDNYELETSVANNITQTSVTLMGSLSDNITIDDLAPETTEIGFLLSKSENDLQYNNIDIIQYTSIDGQSFFSEITDLEPGSTYYYCACIEINGKRIYGNNLSFQTKEIEISEGENIDLGIGVLWRSCNLGADSPEEYGRYYGWGDPIGISSMNRNDYPTIKNISGSGYDAAWYQLGTNYRIPTKEEWEKLRTECTWEWIKYKNTMGYKITGPNNNSIFLPAGGINNGIGFVGDRGFYRIGTQDFVATDYVCHFELSQDYYCTNDDLKEYQMSIRPVYDNNIYGEVNSATDITATTASVSGLIKCSSNVQKIGIWYGTKEYPNIEEGNFISGIYNGDAITANLSNLKVGTTYYYCIYVQREDSIAYYSNTGKFTTSLEVDISTEEAVDLGLSVLWRSYNLSSNTPEDIGESYSILRSSTGNYISGTIYDPTVKMLGTTWRTPDQEEIEELRSKCIWIKKTYKNIDGWQVIGENGNSIFLPLNSNNSSTFYLCGQYYKIVSYYMKAIELTSEEHSISGIAVGTSGCIRPVKDK